MGEAKNPSSDGSIGGGNNAYYGGAPTPAAGTGYGPAASGSSIASIGLSAYGAILQSRGTQKADEFKAERLERAAAIGRTAATQTAAQYSEDLVKTLGNIDAIRAAAHTDPTSPTGVAVRERADYLGTRAKTAAVANILAQSDQQEADARYLRYAGKEALLAGKISAASTILKGISGMGMPAGMPSG